MRWEDGKRCSGGQQNAADGSQEDVVPSWKVCNVLSRVDAVGPNRPFVRLHLADLLKQGSQRVGPYGRTSAMKEGP